MTYGRRRETPGVCFGISGFAMMQVKMSGSADA